MFRILCAMTVCLSFFTGCSSSGTPQEKLYDIKGNVVSIDRAKKTVTLDHQDIPGKMKAMQMPFAVEHMKMLDGLAEGDAVEGRFKDVEGSYVLTELRKAAAKAGADAKKNDVNASLAKLNPEDRLLAEEQRLCPVSDKPLGSMDVPIKLTLHGGTAFICCSACEKQARKNEAETLRNVAALKKK